MRKLEGLAAGLCAFMLLLAGCAPAVTDEPTPTPTAEVTADTVVGDVAVVVAGSSFEITAYPLVRADDMLVLTLDLKADEEPGALEFTPAFLMGGAWDSGSVAALRLQRWIGVRLIDFAGDRVVTPATNGEGRTVFAEEDVKRGAPDQRMQFAFVDPGVDKLSLYLPKSDGILDLPVIDDAVPALGGESKPLALETITEAGVFPMTSYTVDTASSSTTEADADASVIALGADVLFAYDSAELTPAAQGVIAAAAAAIQAREPGSVQVVGHTDSDGDETYNQTLSEQRAAAVDAALRALIDTDDYPTVVSGRGETAPVADNSSNNGRAQNRRVELVIETPQREVAATVTKVALPEIDGPVATGAEGLMFDDTRPYRVTAPRAFVIDGHLVVEVHVTALDDDADPSFGPAMFQGFFPAPAGLERGRSMAGVAVMQGAVATLPVLHVARESFPEDLVPLTDLYTINSLHGGDERTTLLVYPEGLAIGDTVTIETLGIYNPGWRLTDIPVEER